MADSLYELLLPSLDRPPPPPPARDVTTARYLARLPTLSLAALADSEPQSLAQSTHSNLVSLQALANRSHKAFISSADHLSSLRSSLPRLAAETATLRDAIPVLDEEAVCFSSRYSRAGENPILDRRKKAMQLARNADRLSDILELPALLSTAVSSSSINATAAGNAAASTNYSSALDLFAHIKRLQALYYDSPLMRDVSRQAEDAMRDMTSSLIASLKVQNIRLAAAMRTVGWLRRVAPELEHPASNEGTFGALFLVCRLANLLKMLGALEPLRELADLETEKRLQAGGNQSDAKNGAKNLWASGQQTERFLKRYIEIFREQSFAIVSLYKNIFAPAPLESGTIPDGGSPEGDKSAKEEPSKRDDTLSQLPSALATFPMHLSQLLLDTLSTYLPNVQDKGSRESLLTQVLYCAASLGRLGGDFSMILSFLSGDDDDDDEEPVDADVVPEWEKAMKQHRMLAERLDSLTSKAVS